MHVLTVDNVNQAYAKGLELLQREGVRQTSRAGDVLALPYPLTICYTKPWQRVLFDANRDANPFFHLFEACWMLAGRNDGAFLDRFIHDFSSRFAEENGRIHGAYGYRWRRHFDLEGEGHPYLPDQLETVVQLLKKNPFDRRAVIQMWDPVADLAAEKKDVPCNTTIFPRIREVWGGPVVPKGTPEGTPIPDVRVKRFVLDLTVCCRSNDFVWGMTGANAVHFAFLQEYLAGRIGVGLGRYYQIANNAHIYVNTLEKLKAKGSADHRSEPYPETASVAENWDAFDADLHRFLRWVEHPNSQVPDFTNSWFAETAAPLLAAHSMWKAGSREGVIAFLENYDRCSRDWKEAAWAWFERRLKKEAT